MNLFTILLVLHVTGGGLSLLLGSYVLLTRKGGRRHRLIGNIYFFAMLTSALISLPMAYLHPNYFLFIIGVFTAYMLLTGKRAMRLKSLTDVRPGDWILTGVMIIFGLGFIVFGAYNLLSGKTFGVVLLVFGVVSLLFTRQDISRLRGRSPVKNVWLTTHIQRMMGSYIAAATAFIVVNNQFLPPVVAWLLPTAVLTPLIVKWTRKYGVKIPVG